MGEIWSNDKCSSECTEFLVHECFDLKLEGSQAWKCRSGFQQQTRNNQTCYQSSVREDIQEHKNLLLMHCFSGAYWKMISSKRRLNLQRGEPEFQEKENESQDRCKGIPRKMVKKREPQEDNHLRDLDSQFNLCRRMEGSRKDASKRKRKRKKNRLSSK